MAVPETPRRNPRALSDRETKTAELVELLRRLTISVRSFADGNGLSLPQYEGGAGIYQWPEALRNLFWAMCELNDKAEALLKEMEGNHV